MKIRHRADINAKQAARALAHPALGSEGTKAVSARANIATNPVIAGLNFNVAIPTPVYPPKRTLKCESPKVVRSSLIAF